VVCLEQRPQGDNDEEYEQQEGKADRDADGIESHRQQDRPKKPQHPDAKSEAKEYDEDSSQGDEHHALG
jgi:hypothetical protein